MELPFELKQTKAQLKSNWKKYGLKVTEEEFESIYYMYIFATECDLCNKKFKNTKDRQMEHNHETGEFRNIVCNSCNQKKHDIKISKNNKSGYTGISKHYGKTFKQGFIWEFKVTIDGKRKKIKSSIDLEFLIKYAEEWKKKNLYNT